MSKTLRVKKIKASLLFSIKVFYLFFILLLVKQIDESFFIFKQIKI